MGPPFRPATLRRFATCAEVFFGYNWTVFKDSPIPQNGRWLITAIFAACAILPAPIILMTLPALSQSMHLVLIGVCLMWLAPLYYCSMRGQHWARQLTGLLALGAICLLLANWAPGRAVLSLSLMLVAGAAWLALTFVRLVRSPVPW